MSIICKICNIEFKKIIPWQHLKTHNITSKEYAQQYGSLYSQETLEKHRLKVPHNKGKKITDLHQLEKLRKSIEKREQRFQQGEFVRGSKKTQEQKEVLSTKSRTYAAGHKSELKERAAKATRTKISNGFDFGSPMRGKTHSLETRQQLKQHTEELNKKKSNQAHDRIRNLLSSYNLSVINSLSDSILNIRCGACSNVFSFTKQYFSPSKTFSEMCPVCFPRDYTQSKGEKELFDFVSSICPDAVSGYRQSYHDKELDIYIPSKQIGIEYNGLYWHSESIFVANGKSPMSDFSKFQYFEKQNIRVLGIFSDEWNTQQEIVKSRIKNIIGATSDRIYARKCMIRSVSSKESSEFCQQHHIMGRGRSNIRLGLYHNNVLVSLMTFVNSNLSRKSTVWEINRFASVKDTVVIGGASKIFKEFLKLIAPETVISYSDNRWSDGKLYKSLGFEKKSNGTPNYWYFLPNSETRIHRFTLRKNSKDNQALTEYENRQAQGYLRIWDYGSSKWEWNKSSLGL